MLKIKQVAEQLGCAASTVYKLVEAGRIECYRCPGLRISQSQLETYLHSVRRGRKFKTTAVKTSRPRLRHIKL